MIRRFLAVVFFLMAAVALLTDRAMADVIAALLFGIFVLLSMVVDRLPSKGGLL